MSKKNCWEYMNCGRQPGGSQAAELGICPVALETSCDGINGGQKAGRCCWAITGTLCKGEVQGTFARKLRNCLLCEFYLAVEKEEGRAFVLVIEDA